MARVFQSVDPPRIADPVSSPRQTRDAIDKYCERFETDMLKLFDRYYRKGDPKMMHVGCSAA